MRWPGGAVCPDDGPNAGDEPQLQLQRRRRTRVPAHSASAPHPTTRPASDPATTPPRSVPAATAATTLVVGRHWPRRSHRPSVGHPQCRPHPRNCGPIGTTRHVIAAVRTSARDVHFGPFRFIAFRIPHVSCHRDAGHEPAPRLTIVRTPAILDVIVRSLPDSVITRARSTRGELIRGQRQVGRLAGTQVEPPRNRP
jgi:hypothetical protein